MKFINMASLKSLSTITILGFGLLYILLPSVNNSLDSFSFAADIRDRQELFSPHHLFYNAFFYIFSRLFHIQNTLGLLCFGNALFATGCLFLTNAIFKDRLDLSYRIPLIILLGSCFGFIRYATEGETYIIPLFFSLWASYIALKEKKIFKAALVASIACLFHQIHFFWWLGLLYFSVNNFPGSKLRNFMIYSLPSWIVPVAYFLSFYFTNNDSTNVFEFIFHDYMKYEDVKFELNYLSFMLTPISFIRTFFQVHGYMYGLILKYKIPGFIVVISVSLFLWGCYKSKDTNIAKNSNDRERKFALSHLLIFVLQLIFAFISDGNAEFMVMLPFALCLYLFFRFNFKNLFISYFAASILLWNISLSIIPYHFLQIIPDFTVSHFIKEHPDEVFFLKDRSWAISILNYRQPHTEYNIYSIYTEENKLDSILNSREYVVSDILTASSPSRSSIVNKKSKDFYEKYTSTPYDTSYYDMGEVIWVTLRKNR